MYTPVYSRCSNSFAVRLFNLCCHRRAGLRHQFERVGVDPTESRDQEQARALVKGWTAALDELRKVLADSTVFLATYDAEKAQQEFGKLTTEYERAKASVFPRRKFTFSKRTRANLASARAVASADSKSASSHCASSHLASQEARHDSSTSAQGRQLEQGDSLARFEKDLTTIENVEKATLTLRAGRVVDETTGTEVAVLAQKGGDLRLFNLTNCVITL